MAELGRFAWRIRDTPRKLAKALRGRTRGARSAAAADGLRSTKARPATASPRPWRRAASATVIGAETRSLSSSMPRHHFLVFELNGTLYCYSTRGDLCVAKADGKVGPITDQGIRVIMAKKDLTKSILRRYGFNVPEGVAFHRNSLSAATSYFSALLATAPDGICVKPTAGKRGRRVYLGLRDLPSFHAAFKAVAKAFDQVLIEEVVAGTVYRYFCLAGRAIAIRRGVPANVVGDATHSIAELIATKNQERARDGSGSAISVTGPGLTLLKDQGMSPDLDPSSGRNRLAQPGVQPRSRRRHR